MGKIQVLNKFNQQKTFNPKKYETFMKKYETTRSI